MKFRPSFFLLFAAAGAMVLIIAFAVSRRTAPQPNVVFISIDTLRADHLGCYGYGRNTSPSIDALAKESLVFENAVSQAGYTLPSYMALFTSQYPNENRVGRGMDDFRILEDRTTLAEVLKGAGYKTVGFTDGGFLRGMFGFSQGFDLYHDDRWTPTDSILDGDHMEKSLLPWLEENREAPFFLFLYAISYVHGPYEPPPGYCEEFLSDDLYKGDRQVAVSEFGNKEFSRIPGYQNLDNSTDVDLYIAKYDGEIKYMDSRIGVLLKKLKSLRILDNTILIFSADHGESLGEHEWYFDHAVLYDSVIRVPLIIRYPALHKGGRRIRGVVHLIDILPTLADILQIPLQEEEIRGRSLLPLVLEGREVNPVTFSAHGNMNPFSVRQGKWKLIYKIPARSPEWSWQSMPGLSPKERFQPHFELYDLEKDPYETRNLAGESEYRGKVLDLLAKLEKSVDFTLKNTLRREGKKRRLDKKTKDQLRELGYVVE